MAKAPRTSTRAPRAPAPAPAASIVAAPVTPVVASEPVPTPDRTPPVPVIPVDTAPAATVIGLDLASGPDATVLSEIRILVGQEGPGLSRVPGRTLIVGVDIDADEAQRLVEASYAEFP